MAGAGTQASLRKALGAIKDSTTVGLAKVNSDYKELDIAIVKATNHVERPAKERHITAIFSAITATRPRADVAYCIHALARRLAKTRNWAVAIKTLIVIHRALREVDPTFHEELINYGRNRNHMLNMAHFKDDSSPNAWDYSTWVRSYALFLEERLECFRVMKYDVEMDRPRTKELNTSELLEQLPTLQQLLHRVIACQPQGAAMHNFVIQLAFTMVASESARIYSAISDGTANLVDKFFDMQRDDAVKALAIYRRAGQQVERLSEFYEICKSLDIGRGEKFTKIEQPPVSFVQAMEEYVRDAPKEAPKVVLAIDYKKHSDVDEARSPSLKSHEHKIPEPVRVEEPVAEPPDLLGLDAPVPPQDPSGLEEKNALALAIVPVTGDEPVPSSSGLTNGTSGWELALVTAPSSSDDGSVSKLGGGLDKLTLDSLYEEADRRRNQNTSYNPWEPATPSGAPIFSPHSPFMSTTQIAVPPAVQMAGIAYQQQQAFMWQQQQQMMMMMSATPQQQQHSQQQQSNPFGNPYGMPYSSAMPTAQSYNNPYGRFM